jgi:hypothetical protein
VRTLQRALALLEGWPSLSDEVFTAARLAHALFDVGRLAEARPLLTWGQHAAARAGMVEHAAQFATNHGLMLLAVERPEEAREALGWALRSGCRLPLLHAAIRLGLGLVHVANRELGEALALLDDAAEAALRADPGWCARIAATRELVEALATDPERIDGTWPAQDLESHAVSGALRAHRARGVRLAEPESRVGT